MFNFAISIIMTIITTELHLFYVYSTRGWCCVKQGGLYDSMMLFLNGLVFWSTTWFVLQ